MWKFKLKSVYQNVNLDYLFIFIKYQSLGTDFYGDIFRNFRFFIKMLKLFKLFYKNKFKNWTQFTVNIDKRFYTLFGYNFTKNKAFYIVSKNAVFPFFYFDLILSEKSQHDSNIYVQ